MAVERGLDASQLLISHVIHELVSPIGAVNNGVELLEELDGDGLEQDALGLIAQSGRMAARKLQFYRVAYGTAGVSQEFQPGQARQLAADLLAGDGRIKLDWPAGPAVPLAAGAAQLLMNLVLLAGSTLPRGGTVAVAFGTRRGAGLALALTATGQGARITEGVRAAALGTVRSLEHSTIHAWFCAQLAGRLGVSLAIRPEADSVRIDTTLPLAAE